MAKTLVEQYTDIRAKLVEKENAAKKDVINIITDLKPIMKQLEDIQAELVPGEFAFNQIALHRYSFGT